MKSIILLLLALTLPAANSGHSTISVDRSRALGIYGPIDEPTLAMAQSIVLLASQSTDPIDIVINSPGGSVIIGQVLTQAMDIARERGVKIRCIVTVLAASMAFELLPHCDERYALPNSQLLFHPMRATVGRPITEQDARNIADEMQGEELVMKERLMDMMGMATDVFERWYQAERLWSARMLVAASSKPWLTIVTDIQNIDQELFLNPTEAPGGPSQRRPKIRPR